MKLLKLGIVVTLLACASANAQTVLEQGFDNPPASAKPGTWFHVMSGNMSKEGITLDLEAMARVGIGHVTMFHVTQGIPLGRVKFASEEHIALVAHAAAEAKRLGITFGLHNTDGWTSSGGPWITPAQSMKRVVWSEAVVKGGRIATKLPLPPNMMGYYKDFATIAFPAQRGDAEDKELAMTVAGTGTNFNAGIVTDRLHNAATTVELDGQEAVLTVDLGKPTQIAHADMLAGTWPSAEFQVSASDDGTNWQSITKMVKSRSGKNEATITANWDPTQARFFRISSPAAFPVIEIRLSSAQRINDFYALTSLSNDKERTNSGTAQIEGEPMKNAYKLAAIDPAKIIDLSQSLQSDGTLAAKLPKGDWTILRVGYTTTGAVNVPASLEGTGLEVDKFSKTAVETHYNAYMRKVIDAARAIRPDAFDRTIIDSYEVGGQNWTQGYEALFAEATGQNILPYLPLYTGRVVGNVQQSTAFIHSIRNLNSKLMADNYFGHFSTLAHRDKLKVYIEAYGFGPFSDIDAAKHADIPMGEFWLARPVEQMSAMISAGHIYGRPEIAAEAFTALQGLNWSFYPGMAKTRGDDAWTKGINAFVFHRFAHQPNTHVKPGMTMNRWGSHFDRHQPWWDKAGKAWFQYMARGQFLLQQGYAVADVAYFVGDRGPSTCPGFELQSAWLPAGFKADCINSDVLINRSKIVDGTLMLPEGNRYSAIILGNSREIAPATLKRLEQIAAGGVMIFGEKPAPMMSLGATEAEAIALRTRIDALWAGSAIKPISKLASTLPEKQAPRFNNAGNVKLPFNLRRTVEGDVYFTYNPTDKAGNFSVSVLGGDRQPELWDAVTGERRLLEDYDHHPSGQTTFDLSLAAGQSIFILFRKPDQFASRISTLPHLQNAANSEPSVHDLKDWSIVLADAAGGSLNLSKGPLIDLKDHPDSHARDFAGIASYRNALILKSADLKGAKQAILDLGSVAVAATIRVNGKEIATSWMPPHRLDILATLKTGNNMIEIEVATLWSNRLIADAVHPDTSGFTVADRSNNPTTKMVDWYSANQPPPAGPRKTFSTHSFFKLGDPRVSSGLIGPVKLEILK